MGLECDLKICIKMMFVPQLLTLRLFVWKNFCYLKFLTTTGINIQHEFFVCLNILVEF